MSVFVIPFFGKLNEFSRLSIDTLSNCIEQVVVITDDISFASSNPNVEVIRLDLEQVSKIATKKLNRDICLDSPYKLCDLKPFYGIIFEDFLPASKTICIGDADCIYSLKLGNIVKNFEREYGEDIAIGGDRGHFMIMTKLFSNRVKELSIDYFGEELFSKIITSKKNYAFDEFDYLHKMLLFFSKNNSVIWLKEIFSSHIDFSYWERLPLVTGKQVKEISFSRNVIDIELEQNVTLSPVYLHIQKRKVKVNNSRSSDFYISFNKDGSVCIADSNSEIPYDKNRISDLSWKISRVTNRIHAKIKREKIIRKKSTKNK
ncbi:DUF6625 family protein [Vibrio breoganii]|uniref:DUF6625 family protein n=1 Tax=Vibrio breoganii TaxID=553239 RepID=UPI000C826B00|nr:DUF6625 family protein [Vibrio breoganii]PMK51039.1 hypothetical protein BCT97_18480 [Vibrio breoganii]PMO29326.1 hypothetical protein BCT14_06350 [Vibrio breoganii]